MAFFSLISALPAFAQTTPAEPAPETSDQAVTPPLPSFFETNQVETGSAPVNPGSGAPPIAGTSQLYSPPTQPSSISTTPFHWGWLGLAPHIFYQVSYGNGLQASPGQQANTLVNQVSPGILLGLGSHWTIDYTPTLRFYSSSQFKDGTDQFVNLQGGTVYQDWTFGLAQSYSSTSEPLIQTGGQTDQETYLTTLTAAYQFSSRMSLSLSANQNFRFVNQAVGSEALTNLREWSTLEWLNYQFAPSLEGGVGAGFTFDDMEVGPDIVSEQIQGRVSWKPGSKLRFILSGGVNSQQFLGSSEPNLLSPIFSLSAQYQLFEPTSLSLTGSQSVSPAYFQGVTSESLGISVGLHQRLLYRLFLDVNAGYTSTTYHPTTTAVPVNPAIGNYNSTSYGVALSTVFLKKATASIFYQTTYNSSGSTLYNYNTHQGGFTLGYHF